MTMTLGKGIWLLAYTDFEMYVPNYEFTATSQQDLLNPQLFQKKSSDIALVNLKPWEIKYLLCVFNFVECIG